jgi:nicotinamide riboside transporter PnuC
MELDNIENSNQDWDSKPMTITNVTSIVFGGVISIFFLAMMLIVGEETEMIEREIEKGDVPITVDTFITVMRVMIFVFLIPFILNVVGAIMLLRNKEKGWMLFIVTNVISTIILLLFLLVSGSSMFVILTAAYVGLAIAGNKYHYKVEEKFENYSN